MGLNFKWKIKVSGDRDFAIKVFKITIYLVLKDLGFSPQNRTPHISLSFGKIRENQHPLCGYF
jgi:hypothetical protein